MSSALPYEVLCELCLPYPQQLVVSEHLWSFQDRDPFEFVTGPLIPCVAAHYRNENLLAQSLSHHLGMLASTPCAPRYFAGVANHDSLPCPADVAECLLTAFVLLPGSVPFLYSGTEWDCAVATNLEFGSFELAQEVPAQGLLLFNHRPVTVDESRLTAFTAFWSVLLQLRRSLGTAVMPASSLQQVRRSGALVRFSVGAVEIVVNTGAEPARTDASNDSFGFMLGTRDFSFDGFQLTLAPRSTVVITPAECQLPTGMSDAFRCLKGFS
ncbi:hypothetical protein [Polaromonas naphthalenivorans]|uniref:Uncharacterized protein n=1 Tax=Polaromonas naphthalenivorans (strain CJ2) TaxID=365044 RepID=A1VWS6_POLNA|nr:hypothetical protein [Polaromonas naphthalenivorans]ABM40104.1 hypothetical protein Pnap_4689 [Polaromonas naphthalenivorans CJ2]